VAIVTSDGWGSGARVQVGRGWVERFATKGAPMSLLWIILIVVLVLVLLGAFGRGRF
jgi:hypothetical protein